MDRAADEARLDPMIMSPTDTLAFAQRQFTAYKAFAPLMGPQIARAVSVLLFGGTGLIGRHVVRALIAQGASVTVASRGPPRDASISQRRMQWLPCDIGHVGEVRRAFRTARPRKVITSPPRFSSPATMTLA